MHFKNLIIFLFLFFQVFSVLCQDGITIYGKITNEEGVLTDVNITVLETGKSMTNEEDGSYSITVKPNQTLVFQKSNWITQNIFIEDISRVLNINMVPEIQLLEEVVVTKEDKYQKMIDIQKEYETNENLIRSLFGVIDKKKSPYSMQIIKEEDLTLGFDFLSIIESKVPGARVVESKVFFRNSLTPAIFDVDGMILREAPHGIPPSNIKRIAVIKSSSLGLRYGMRASGGVIIINTKSANQLLEPGSNEFFDYARIRNNVYDKGMVREFENLTKSKYIIALERAYDAKEALQLYNQYHLWINSSGYNLIDVAILFWEKWNNKEITMAILSEVYEKFPDNSEILKALAYAYEQLNEPEMALEIYKVILKLRPRYGQSYRDLANAYVQTKNWVQGLKLYSRYITSRKIDTIKHMDEGIDSIIKSEYQNALILSASEVFDNKNISINSFCCTRVVIEWNTSEAEFDLQVVTPEDDYYIWSHTNEENIELINEEKQNGYSMKEIVLDNNFFGNWLINIKYYGNKSFDPTYLKATTYYHYGKPNQMQKSFYFKLTEKNVYQSLISVVNRPTNELITKH